MKIKFLGATRQVTGSSYFLNAGGVKILIDCGLFQERDYSHRNWEAFPIPPNQIQHILLTHVHLDHCGLVPKLVKEGFAGDILLTSASKELFPIVILDSARIQEEDAVYEKKRHEKEGKKEPLSETLLYNVQDAEKCFPLLKDVSYEEYVQLSDRVKVCFHDAGHILGSAMIEVIVQDENVSRNIIFSGDIGQWNKPLLGNPSVFDRADYVVMESTYGDRNHDNSQDIDERLSKIVNDTVNEGGNVLIPTFAIERAQELLYHFSRLAQAEKIPYIVTFLDSPMAIEITRVFERSMKYFDKETSDLFRNGQSPFEFPGLMFAKTVEASKAINLIKGSTVIMASSGMLTGGRIQHHLIRNIARPESTLIFVGYQAAGTLGRQILDGMSPVEIYGQSYPVRMKIERIDAFSAHADMNDLERWLNNFKSPPNHVFLIHGEEESMMSLKTYLQSKSGWTVSTPTYLEEYDI
ncbi:MAG: metallo-beta-lactamase family protein [Thermoproteota archaeon]|nr:metallo-beta-lactamase family protein [Thermoproteota archaeon]